MEPYHIREITPEDNHAVTALVRQVIVEMEVPIEGSAYHDEALNDMYSAYQEENHSYFVVEANGTIIGCAGIGPLEHADGKVCELQKMYFLKDARGKGIGAKMIQKCLDAAKAFGFEACYLETMPNMIAAQKLYQKNGFEYLEERMGATGHFSCPVWMIKRF
ncbi:MAG: GNAT family N-acetyltransferase [Bacteroidota bacterium]